MKRNLSKVLAVTLILSMCLSTAGFSVKTQKAATPIKLDVFTMTGNYAGEQTGWFAKIIKDKFNVELNIISSNLLGGDSKFATMMAAGDLGDIVVFGKDDQKYTDAIKAGLLLDWTKNDLINKHARYIVDNFPKAVVKAKNNFGNGKSVYGIGDSVANMSPLVSADGTTMVWGPDLRWDVYEKIGKPKMKTMEDLLPVLKKMQQAEPKSDSGRPTYAFSMWADWDGNMMMNAKQFACMQGYDEFGLLLVHGNQDKYQELLDPKGYYLRTLKLYYKANQMGLVDPDSISQKYDDVASKIKDGQILFCWFPWMDQIYNTPERKAAGKGFMFVPFSDIKMYSQGFANYGGNQIIAIGSKTRYPEKVMDLINWLYTPEGVMTQQNGPKGLTWDLKNGKPYVTVYGKKALQDNDVTVPKEYGGGLYRDGVNCMNFAAVNVNSINLETKEPYNSQLWTSTLNTSPSKLELNWRKAMKAKDQHDYLTKNNMLVVSPVTTFSPDEMSIGLQQKAGQIATIIKQDSWKMVFAKNDTEYNELQMDMITRAKALGYDDVVKFWITQAKKEFAIRKSVK